MTYRFRHSDSVHRHCSRCFRELTDAASREAGVGPVCRGKDNTIFARQMPARISEATVQVMALDASIFGDNAENFTTIREDFLSRATKAMRDHDGATVLPVAGADFRSFVDWLDCSLSYRFKAVNRNSLIAIIESLGYVSLASVLRGTACMSKATLSIEGDRVVLKGKSNKPGLKAMKTAFGRNVKTPRWRGDATPYSVHVSEAGKFVEIALRYWPFMEDVGTIEHKIVEEAAPLAVKNPVVVKDTRPNATMFVGATELRVRTPWTGTRAQMMQQVSFIKEVPARDRRWCSARECWVIKKAHHDFVLGQIKRTSLYGKVVITEG